MRPQLDAISNLLETGSADAAVRMIRGAWHPDLRPDERVPLFCMWIRGLCELNELDHAVVLARRARDEFPRNPDVLTALGNVLDLRGELDDALEVFTLAVELEPDSSLSHYNLAAVLDRRGNEELAEKHFQSSLEHATDTTPMPEAVAALGSLLRRQGRLEEAEEIYDEYLLEDPLDVELLVEHGICLSDLDLHDEALARFENALTLDPGHASAWYNKGITLYRAGRYEGAFAAMECARDREPNNPLAQAVLGAWILADREGDLDRGLRLIYGAKEALDASWNRGDLHPNYAWLVIEEVFEALWGCGRRREARDVARTAAARDWITPHILTTMNRDDRGNGENSPVFNVRTSVQRPLDESSEWPANAAAFVIEVAVVADSPAQASEFALDYLRWVENRPSLVADTKIADQPVAPDEVDISANVRGVARVLAPRIYVDPSGQALAHR
jgi:tetratricopeptide (TPR) repeat protein